MSRDLVRHFDLRNQIQYISEELRKFRVPQPTVSEKELDFTTIEKHGRRNAYGAAHAMQTSMGITRRDYERLPADAKTKAVTLQA